MNVAPYRRWAGLLLGPAAWMLVILAGNGALPWACAHHANPVPWLAAGGVLLALLGAALSWGAWRAGPAATTRLVAALSVGLALLFALTIAMQGAASAWLSGCER